MLEVYSAGSRGATRLAWLDSRHTFSFGDYHDPARMGFGVLRVLNEDVVAPGQGFGQHPHRDMEILTWVLEGSLRHEDTLGNGSVLRPGEIQRMTAGRGILHSEANASATEPVHFLQIWILPDRRGLAPGYEQESFGREALRDRLVAVAQPGGTGGAVSLHQDATVLVGVLRDGVEAVYDLDPGRQAWLHVARGLVAVGDVTLREGDGAGVRSVDRLRIVGAGSEAEVLLLDLP